MRRLQPASVSIVHYPLAILAVAITTVVLTLVRDALNSPIIALLYLLPVVFSTALWGLGPGVAAALSAFLSFNFFFILPYYTLAVHQTQDVLALIVFLVVAVVISQLLGQARVGMAAATAREREATQLYELSTALAGLQDERAIAHTLAEHLLETFQATRVELKVEGHAGGKAFEVCLPDRSGGVSDSAIQHVPLMTARGLQGEIRLGRNESPLALSEERLLRTFASQGALALERARLAQSETRAKVLEESDRLKSALLSSVSHELRTPLATIKASVTSLHSGEVGWASEAREELLAAIEDETDRLNRLVGNLLDMSRIEAGALKPQRNWNDLAEIAGGVIARLRQATQRHRIETDFPENLPLLPVDYVQMEQVFSNLITNSIKYSPENTAVRISARLHGDSTLLVRVSNEGPHVPEEHLDRIFDKFYRVTDADRVTGTGLGLSICKGIIEAHGGRIWAENLPDGFAFNFILPLVWEGVPPPTMPSENNTNE